MERLAHTVTTTDRVTIAFDLYRQAGQESVIVVCPGFFQSKETPTFQRLARALAVGRDVLCMDFRGHGRSGGWYTFSAREGADLAAVLDYAAARYRRVGLLGFSLGGAIAINTLSWRAGQVRSVVAVSAPSAFADIEFQWWTPAALRCGMQGMEPGAGCRPGNGWLPKERPVECVAQLHPRPLLFLHGARDVIVGVRHSRRLYAAAREPKGLEIIDGDSHAEALFRDDPQGFIHRVQCWFDQTLG